MRRNTIKKLGIFITSAMLAATSVLAPFTTLTVYAENVAVGDTIVKNEGSIETNNGTIERNDGTIETNDGAVDENYGTIGNNSGEVDTNWSKGKIENNEATGTIDGNYGKVENNLDGATINDNYGTVSCNKSGGTIKFSSFLVLTNEGDVKDNCGQVVDNNSSGNIDENNNIVINNKGTIKENYGSVNNNTGTIVNNYTSINGYGVVVDNNDGTIQNQWYEVNLENNITEVKINGISIKDIDNSGNTDVFVKDNTSITINPINPNKIIDAVTGDDVEYVKNADGSVTINSIKKAYSFLTTLVDKIIEHIPTPKPNNNDEKTEDIASEIVEETTVEAATAANRESVVKELAAAPNQAVVGTAEYEAKQAAIVADLTNQVKSVNNLTAQALATMQKVGVSVATGGCTKLEAANVTLLNELLEKGVPVTLTYAVNGVPVTIKIPANVNLKLFIDADGRIDLTKLSAYIVR